MIAYDLFCGAGGASLGLHQAGYEVLGFDNWELAVESHIANGLPAEVADLVHKDWFFVPTPDLLWASPPCQPFSAAGKRLGQEDERDCMPHFLRAVRQLNYPPVVVMENVQGLTYKKHTAYLEWIVWTLKYHGYVVEWKVLNAADYGVPQTRKRFILIARNDGVAIKWPDPSPEKPPTVAEALGRCAAPWWAERPATTVAGDGRLFQPGGHHTPGSQSQNATKITPIEAAILQGFPRDYRFYGTLTRRRKMIGNAVPPPLARAIVSGL